MTTLSQLTDRLDWVENHPQLLRDRYAVRFERGEIQLIDRVNDFGVVAVFKDAEDALDVCTRLNTRKDGGL